ncbi:MAG: hypothetical protein ACPGR2_12855 [Psychrobium sp.]
MSQFDYRVLIIERLQDLNLELEASSGSDIYEKFAEIEVCKKLAYEIDDFEVLGLASKLEIKYNNIFDSESEYSGDSHYTGREGSPDDYHRTYVAEDNNYSVFYRKIQSEFFSTDDYVVDMQPYKDEVERNKDALIRHGLYANLSRYVENKTATDKAYQKVKADLSKVRDEDNKYITPTEKDIKNSFEIAREDIYRLAKKHVAYQVEASLETS